MLLNYYTLENIQTHGKRLPLAKGSRGTVLQGGGSVGRGVQGDPTEEFPKGVPGELLGPTQWHMF